MIGTTIAQAMDHIGHKDKLRQETTTQALSPDRMRESILPLLEMSSLPSTTNFALRLAPLQQLKPHPLVVKSTPNTNIIGERTRGKGPIRARGVAGAFVRQATSNATNLSERNHVNLQRSSVLRSWPRETFGPLVSVSVVRVIGAAQALRPDIFIA
ncbi:hypothetical protein PQX77_001047 [Marasmius sp. AFHP31]|nr:hypothetical protein PQX77_001047 [Marasmius sp. AFHP31]